MHHTLSYNRVIEARVKAYAYLTYLRMKFYRPRTCEKASQAWHTTGRGFGISATGSVAEKIQQEVFHDLLCNPFGLDAVVAALDIASQCNNPCLSNLYGLA